MISFPDSGSSPETAPTKQVIVYAGKHYGSPHRVLSRNGRELVALHVPSGDQITVNQCETEELPAL